MVIQSEENYSKHSKIHPHWFQAVSMLDMASHKANDSVVTISIPHMHIISAYWKSFFPWPLIYQLGKNGYLVTLSPTAQNKHYSYHMNYTDFSTLQYLPAYKASMVSLYMTKFQKYLSVIGNAASEILMQSIQPLNKSILQNIFTIASTK